jgi:hypothetical protein
MIVFMALAILALGVSMPPMLSERCRLPVAMPLPLLSVVLTSLSMVLTPDPTEWEQRQVKHIPHVPAIYQWRRHLPIISPAFTVVVMIDGCDLVPIPSFILCVLVSCARVPTFPMGQNPPGWINAVEVCVGRHRPHLAEWGVLATVVDTEAHWDPPQIYENFYFMITLFHDNKMLF